MSGSHNTTIDKMCATVLTNILYIFHLNTVQTKQNNNPVLNNKLVDAIIVVAIMKLYFYLHNCSYKI
jgi:hypothetical protein